MKILVISDTHGFILNAEKLIAKYRDKIRTVIHLGDLCNDAALLKIKFPEIDLYSVRGNNDYETEIPFERMLRLNSKNVLITHGHRQRVGYSYMSIGFWAQERGADIVLFGHTHSPLCDLNGAVGLFNPGSLSLPRSTDKPTFGIMDIEDSGRIVCSVMEFDEQSGQVRRLK